MIIKKCIICGKEYKAYSSRSLACSKACKKEREHNVKKTYMHKQKIKQDLINASGTLTEITKRAKEAGMSYGEYVAAAYIEKMRERDFDAK